MDKNTKRLLVKLVVVALVAVGVIYGVSASDIELGLELADKIEGTPTP